MKKGLLFVAALAACMSVSAQESAVVNPEALGITPEKTYIPEKAGFEFAKSASVTMTAAYDDQYQQVGVNGPKDANSNSINIFKVNGTAINTSDAGVQGKSNPKDVNGGTPSTTFLYPVNGAVFKFESTKAGYLYVFFKASSNKSYTVFADQSCIGYKYSQLTSGTKGLPAVMTYELKNAEDEYNILYVEDYTGTESNGSNYAGILWPERIWSKANLSDAEYIAKFSEQPVNKKKPELGTKVDWTKIGENGCAVVKFPVIENLPYYFNANGSKATVLGFYFDTTGDATVSAATADGTTEFTLLDKGELPTAAPTPTGINSVKAETEVANENAPIFNLAGQQVTKAYKGVVIQNGKKFILK